MSSETTTLRALIVDDDADIIAAIKAVMEAELPEYEIDTAINGNVAVGLWKQHQHSLIILDMMLPGQSGFLVTEKVMKEFYPPDGLRWNERPVIIMITANSGHRHRGYATSLGIDGYVLKPFAMPDLMSMIREKVAARQATGKA